MQQQTLIIIFRFSTPKMKKLLGIMLLLLSNVIYIANNYIVKIVGLSASEVSLVRGSLQVMIILRFLK